MENGWTERIAELTESRDHWKREWRLLNAGLNMAEDKIKELEAENKRLRAALENVLLAIDHEDYYNDAVFDEAREALKLAGKEGE